MCCIRTSRVVGTAITAATTEARHENLSRERKDGFQAGLRTYRRELEKNRLVSQQRTTITETALVFRLDVPHLASDSGQSDGTDIGAMAGTGSMGQ